MHPIPKPTPQDKPTFSQWNSTIKRRIVPQVGHHRAYGRGNVLCRPKGHKDPRDWTGPFNRATAAERYRREKRAFPGRVHALYGNRCLHPLLDGTLCGKPGQAHHCHFGRRRRDNDSQHDPRNGTVLCEWPGHHAGSAESVHDCKTPDEGEKWRRRWERFSDTAFEEGPEAALAWNRRTERGG